MYKSDILIHFSTNISHHMDAYILYTYTHNTRNIFKHGENNCKKIFLACSSSLANNMYHLHTLKNLRRYVLNGHSKYAVNIQFIWFKIWFSVTEIWQQHSFLLGEAIRRQLFLCLKSPTCQQTNKNNQK